MASHHFEGIDGDIADLYDIVEVQKLQAVPAAVAADALRLINPELTSDEITKMVKDNDGMGSGSLRQSELSAVIRYAIRNVDLAEASKQLRDLVFRMRVAFRRRYLMYEASPNIAPDFLFENVTMGNHYRMVFDLVAHGADWITRAQLRELLVAILPDNKPAVGSACKAAMGPDDRPNSIGFAEFAMVLHPVTQQIPLSTLAERASAAAARASSSAASAARSPQRPGAWLENLKEKQLDGIGGSYPHRSSTPIISAIRAEMPSYRLESEAAAARINEVLQQSGSAYGGGASKYAVAARRPSFGGGNTSVSPGRGMSVAAESVFFPNSPAKGGPEGPVEGGASAVLMGGDTSRAVEVSVLRDRDTTITQLQEELARAKLEITTLKRDLNNALISNNAGRGDGGKPTMLSSKAYAAGEGGQGRASERQLLDDPFYRINQLEKELKEARVKLSIGSDSQDLYNLLLRSNSTQPLARFYTDEKQLLSKHDYLRRISDIVDPQSPQFVLLSQYELLVCSYQALYRQAADKARNAVAATLSGHAGDTSLLGSSRHRSPSAGASRARSPSAAGARSNSTAQTRHVTGVPFKWSEVDQPVSHEHWKTRTLGDPTLTDEERNLLRQRLAAQMRSAARSRSPHLKVKHVNPNMHYSSRAASVGRAGTPLNTSSVSAAVAAVNGGGSRRGSSALDQSELVKANLTSQETMQRLQALSQIAAKQRFL